MNTVVLTGWSLACLNRQSHSLFTAASYCTQKGYSKEGGQEPEMGNAEEAPMEDCLSSQVDGEEPGPFSANSVQS